MLISIDASLLFFRPLRRYERHYAAAAFHDSSLTFCHLPLSAISLRHAQGYRHSHHVLACRFDIADAA